MDLDTQGDLAGRIWIYEVHGGRGRPPSRIAENAHGGRTSPSADCLSQLERRADKRFAAIQRYVDRSV